MSVLDRPSASTDALVLRTWPCGETSAVASLLTRDHGFVKVIAKAARRPRSQLRALIEPGRLVAVEFSLDPRRELQYLRGGGVELDPLGATPTLERTAFLLGALELLDRCRPAGALVREGEPDSAAAADLFDVCSEFIRMLDSATCRQPALAFFAFEWELLTRHGVAPEVDRCCECGGAAAAETGMRFLPSEGGLQCATCGRSGSAAGRPLSPAAYDVLRALAAGGLDAVATESTLEPAVRREVGAHLHRFLGYHLPGYRLPAALDLLRAGKETTP